MAYPETSITLTQSDTEVGATKAADVDYEHIFVSVTFTRPASLTLMSWHGNQRLNDQQEGNVQVHQAEPTQLDKDADRHRSCSETESLVAGAKKPKALGQLGF